MKQACVGKGVLEETDPGNAQLREGWSTPTLILIAERLYKNSQLQENFLANRERGAFTGFLTASGVVSLR